MPSLTSARCAHSGGAPGSWLFFQELLTISANEEEIYGANADLSFHNLFLAPTSVVILKKSERYFLNLHQ